MLNISMLINIKAITLVSIKGTEKKVSIIAFKINLSIRKNSITVIWYNIILDIIADNLLLDIFSFNFLAFHNPKTVSKQIQKPTKKSKLVTGKKNVHKTASNLGELVRIDASKMNS
jgi:hypothetical protein